MSMSGALTGETFQGISPQILSCKHAADEGNAGDTATGSNSAHQQLVHAGNGAAEDSVHREACQAKGRGVQLMLAQREPGGNAGMR